jgi:Fe-S-cluster containining protein
LTHVNTCQQCGACCASFRVSFYWAEAPERGLPDVLVEKLTTHLANMAGTNQPLPRCRALQGDVGTSVTCVAYPQRPSPCREVQLGDAKCTEARARHGLSPLEPVAASDHALP